MISLDEFVKENLLGKPLVWGENDCTMKCVKWLEANGIYLNIPKYSSMKEAMWLKKKAGGLVNLWDAALTMAGFEQVEEPSKGDIGITETEDSGKVGLIYYGTYWIVTRENGIDPIMIPNRRITETPQTLWVWGLCLDC